MKLNPALVRSAKDEWSDWLERPDAIPSFNITEMRKWIEDRPPMNAFASLVEAIDLMQDEIDLLNIKLKEATEDLHEAKRYLIKRS
jgi:hypothetical protein